MARAIAIHEQCFGTFLDEQRALAQPFFERRERLAADRNDARFRALAGHAHGGIAEIDVRRREARELRETQPRRIKKFVDRLVARREPVVIRDFHQAPRLVGRQRVRQGFLGLGRA